MIRKLIIAVLVLGCLGTAGLWIDSYRVREPSDSKLLHIVTYSGKLPTLLQRELTGLRYDIHMGSAWYGAPSRWTCLRTHLGDMCLRYEAEFKGPASERTSERQWSRFRYYQRTRLSGISSGYWLNGEGGEPGPGALPADNVEGWVPPLEFYHREREVEFPLFLPAALFAVYPTIALIRGPLRRWRRRKCGLCIHCGYNLTGLTGGRCPECGERM